MKALGFFALALAGCNLLIGLHKGELDPGGAAGGGGSTGSGGGPPAQCLKDGKVDGTETDVDCGGGCGPCAAGKACAKASDCATGACAGGTCRVCAKSVVASRTHEANSVTSHACAVASDGAMYCWGFNDNSQLGGGKTPPATSPKKVEGLTPVTTSAAAGARYSCGAGSDGALRCWGLNDGGQLGNGALLDQINPAVVGGLAGVDAVATGRQLTCAHESDGSLWCWGKNDYGEVGVSGAANPQLKPIQVAALAHDVESFACGSHHACAVRSSDGTLRCWGANDARQLGDGSQSPSSPVPVAVNSAELAGGVAAVTAGRSHTCAIRRSDSSLWCWGLNDQGQIGNGEIANAVPLPLPIAALGNDVLAVSGGYGHTCAIRKSDGSVWCWGDNQFGQLGDGSGKVNQPSPVKVQKLANATAVVAGDDFSCAVTGAGLLWCWGKNDAGQLGTGTKSDSAIPVQTAFFCQ